LKTKAFIFATAVSTSMFAQSVIINSPGKKSTDRHPQRHHRPVSSATIPNGTIVFFEWPHHRRRRERVDPEQRHRHRRHRLFVYPGLIDAGSHVGLEEISAVPGTVDTAELATSIRMRAPRLR